MFAESQQLVAANDGNAPNTIIKLSNAAANRLRTTFTIMPQNDVNTFNQLLDTVANHNDVSIRSTMGSQSDWAVLRARTRIWACRGTLIFEAPLASSVLPRTKTPPDLVSGGAS